MKIVVLSSSGEFLPIAWRLRREGTDCSVYVHLPRYRNNYKGILNVLKLKDLHNEIRKADIVIADSNRANKHKKHDIALLKTFGLKASSLSVFGAILDKLRDDRKVIGSSAVTEELMLNQAVSVGIAKEVGFSVLDPKALPGGTEISTEVWVGKDGPVHYNRTIESKRLMVGNFGPTVGSQGNLVWIEEDENSVGIPELTKMAAYLKENGYSGPCSVDMVVKNNTPYFLKWSPGFSYDAIYCLLELLKGKLTDFFAHDFKADFHSGYAASQRLSIPPFPYAVPELLKEYAKDVTIKGELAKMPQFYAQDIYQNLDHLACAGTDGILGIVAARGDSLGSAWGKVYGTINKMKIESPLQIRTDGFKESQKRLATFNKETRRIKIAV